MGTVQELERADLPSDSAYDADLVPHLTLTQALKEARLSV